MTSNVDVTETELVNFNGWLVSRKEQAALKEIHDNFPRIEKLRNQAHARAAELTKAMLLLDPMLDWKLYKGLVERNSEESLLVYGLKLVEENLKAESNVILAGKTFAESAK